MSFGSGGDPNEALRQQQQADAIAVQQGLTDINKQFAGFTPQFYGGVEKAYTAASQPALQQQYKSTRDQIGFKLANQGLDGGSSQQRTLGNNLSTSLVQAQNQIANQAIGQRQALQRDVGNEKSSLIGQLEASKDPAAAGLQAREAALNLGQQPAFDSGAIGNLFGNFANLYLGSQQANAYNQYAQNYLNGYNKSVTGNLYPATTFGLPQPSRITK